ncbi:MAG TPA: TPM domain-containing protein [Edaphobacter sp.]|nr:TPM domain-containing protein [Edaphobacter sp.]
MKCISRWLVVIVLLIGPVGFLSAERVSALPAPTGFVNDFAGVLSPSVKQSVEDLCVQVDRQAHAQIAVVTVKTIDDDMSIEEFATALEDKWKVGPKGTDRGVLMIFVMTPRKGRIEVGYGLEGILNDAKVGDIGRSMVPAASQGDYNTAIPLGVRQIAQVIAADAGVTLTLPIHQYHRQVQQQPIHLSLTQIVLGGGAILLLLFFLAKTGNIGLIFFLLGNLMGGGGRGYRGGGGRDRDDGGGGGFGGFGGGSSGGGGASGDF